MVQAIIIDDSQNSTGQVVTLNFLPIVNEIVPHEGEMYEVVSVDGTNVQLQRITIEEDWGE